jgi:hypothetical protein
VPGLAAAVAQLPTTLPATRGLRQDPLPVTGHEGGEFGRADRRTRYGTLARVKRHDDASARTGARVALLAFLAVGLATAWLVPLPQIHTSPGGVVMPDLIAGFSRSQPSAVTSPPGPTLLTFESGALADSAASESQQVLIGADGITYRKLDEVDVHKGDVFLAPDGRAVLLTEGNELTPSIVHIDLVTGARHEFP